jgi:DNA modification methylase
MQAGITDFLVRRRDSTLVLVGDAMALLPLLPMRCVDMCLTSPPYWAQRRYGNGGIGNERDPQEYVERLHEVFGLVRGVLKPEGSLWLNVGDAYREKNLLGMPWRVASALQNDGWILRNAVVWDKLKGNPCNAPDKLRNTYEMVFHFVTQPDYYYDHESIRTPPQPPQRRNRRTVTPTGVSGVKYERQIRESPLLTDAEREAALKALKEALRRVADRTMPDFRMVIRGCQRTTHSDSVEVSGRANELRNRGFYILPYHPAGSKPGDVWRIIPEDTWRKDAHFAVFPEELCDIPILATCPPSGVVLDPFSGTGTALVRAVTLGRRAIGIEISPEYAHVARERIAEREGRLAVTRRQAALPI